MNIKMENRERRDWGLLILIIPIGILLIVVVGNLAIYFLSSWSINRGMQSSLVPNSPAQGPFSLLEPLLPQILTPPAWGANYLTPIGEVSILPFFNLAPGAAPSATPVSPTPVGTGPTPISTTPVSPSPPVTVTTTAPPGGESSPTPSNTLTATSTPPGTPPAPSNTPITTSTPPTPSDTPITTSTSTPPGSPSTPDPSWSLLTPAPADINLDAPDDNIVHLPSGTYVVLNVSANPVVVLVTPDGYYDLVFYEFINQGAVYLDHIIIGISQADDGSLYYEVFNWGNARPDTNTNVDTAVLPPDPYCPSGGECDNRRIPPSSLYPYPGAGILIDVDTAPSSPPAGSYDYIVIISPASFGSGLSADVDAIVVTEVPIPTGSP